MSAERPASLHHVSLLRAITCPPPISSLEGTTSAMLLELRRSSCWTIVTKALMPDRSDHCVR